MIIWSPDHRAVPGLTVPQGRVGGRGVHFCRRKACSHPGIPALSKATCLPWDAYQGGFEPQFLSHICTCLQDKSVLSRHCPGCPMQPCSQNTHPLCSHWGLGSFKRVCGSASRLWREATWAQTLAPKPSALRPRANFSASLCLSFLIRKMGSTSPRLSKMAGELNEPGRALRRSTSYFIMLVGFIHTFNPRYLHRAGGPWVWSTARDMKGATDSTRSPFGVHLD